MGLATFLFYVTVTTHGYNQIQVVPMPNMETCEKVKTHMLTTIAASEDLKLFNYRHKVFKPLLPECKSF